MTREEIEAEKQELLKLLLKFFNEEKAKLWLKTDNLNFGGTSPEVLIACGRGKRVKEFILNSYHDAQSPQK